MSLVKKNLVLSCPEQKWSKDYRTAVCPKCHSERRHETKLVAYGILEGCPLFFSFETTPLLGLDVLSLFWDGSESHQGHQECFLPGPSPPHILWAGIKRSNLEGGRWKESEGWTRGWPGSGEAPSQPCGQQSPGLGWWDDPPAWECTFQWLLMSFTDETTIFR